MDRESLIEVSVAEDILDAYVLGDDGGGAIGLGEVLECIGVLERCGVLYGSVVRVVRRAFCAPRTSSIA